MENLNEIKEKIRVHELEIARLRKLYDKIKNTQSNIDEMYSNKYFIIEEEYSTSYIKVNNVITISSKDILLIEGEKISILDNNSVIKSYDMSIGQIFLPINNYVKETTEEIFYEAKNNLKKFIKNV